MPDVLLFDDAATRALGVLHFTHRFVLLAGHTALIGRFTIPITTFIEIFGRIAHVLNLLWVILRKIIRTKAFPVMNLR